MTGLVRKAMLLSVLGLLVAGAAFASVPNPANSTIPVGITLVGTTAGVADPYGQFTVTVRDFSNNLIPNSSVILDFSANTPDIKIQSTQPFAGLTTDCTTKTVRALTNASGVATFRIVGSSIGPVTSGFTKGTVLADGVVLGHTEVAALDLDGVGGAGANDLSVWTAYFLATQAAGAGDYDYNGSLGANDLSVWVAAFLSAGSTVSSSPNCP